MIEYKVEQGSQEWHELRCGKITSSRIAKVYSSTNLALVDELIAERFLKYSDNDDDFINGDMQRGNDLEPIAADEYTAKFGIELERVGFCVSDKYSWLGCSPDRFTPDRKGGIEIKSPRAKGHIMYIRMGGIPNKHKEQIWNYFLVNEKLEWLDFVSFCPNFTIKPLYVYRINRADILADLIEAESKLVAFNAKLEKYESEILF